MWCVPFLKHLHSQHSQGVLPDLAVSPEQYMRDRSAYRVAGREATRKKPPQEVEET